MLKRVNIKVEGIVQGVFFRWNAKKVARGLDLKGLVWNEPDVATVKIIAEGEEENLKKLIDWAKKGPKRAKVQKIETKWEEPKHDFNSFRMRIF